jgi:hypothetical protein
LDQTNKKLEVDQMYYGRWQDVLQQINTENALAEQKRQADLADKRAKAQLAEQKRQFDAQMEYQKQQATTISKGSGGSNAGKKAGTKTLGAGAKKTAAVSGNKSSTSKSSKIVVVNSPLTAEGAAQKVASGELIVTKQEGNRIWVARNPNYTKGQSTLDKYTNLAKWANGR